MPGCSRRRISRTGPGLLPGLAERPVDHGTQGAKLLLAILQGGPLHGRVHGQALALTLQVLDHPVAGDHRLLPFFEPTRVHQGLAPAQPVRGVGAGVRMPLGHPAQQGAPEHEPGDALGALPHLGDGVLHAPADEEGEAEAAEDEKEVAGDLVHGAEEVEVEGGGDAEDCDGDAEKQRGTVPGPAEGVDRGGDDDLEERDSRGERADGERGEEEDADDAPRRAHLDEGMGQGDEEGADGARAHLALQAQREEQIPHCPSTNVPSQQSQYINSYSSWKSSQ